MPPTLFSSTDQRRDQTDRYFLLTDEEAEDAWGSDYTKYWNGLRGGYLGGYVMILDDCLLV